MTPADQADNANIYAPFIHSTDIMLQLSSQIISSYYSIINFALHVIIY
jgi:hypothetical protein